MFFELFLKFEVLMFGVELELQFVNCYDYDFVLVLFDLLCMFKGKEYFGDIKLEIIDLMIEIFMGICYSYDEVFWQLCEMCDCMVEVVMVLNIGICGGGMYLFQQWSQCQIL